MKKPSLKKALSYFILFSFACGPSTDLSQYFSVFYPEAAENPKATEPYFFTNEVLAKQYFMHSSAYLADSINLESWYQYADKKITKEDIKLGLYEKNDGEHFASILKSINKNEASEYVLLAQEIDKEVLKFETDWEEGEPLNEQLLGDAREAILVKLARIKDDFLIERYIFQALKIGAKLKDWEGLMKDYDSFKPLMKKPTFISEWCESRYAGALLKSGKRAEAVLAFAKVFENSPSRRNQADLSIRHLDNLNFKDALLLAKTDQEKLSVMALQAVQPNQDGLELLMEMAAINPNHTMLELVMAREINKNEVNFYAEKNAGSYVWDMDIYTADYKIDSTKAKVIKKESLGYFGKLLTFNESLIQDDNLEKKGFWLTTSAYLSYILGDIPKMKYELALAEKEHTTNQHLKHQIKVFKALSVLDDGTSELEILKEIQSLKEVSGFRDSNVLTLLSEKLQKYYSLQKEETKEPSGWLQSCKNEPSKPDAPNTNKIKGFLAKHIPASKEDYSLYSSTLSEAQLLKTADVKTLEATLKFMEGKNNTKEENLLIDLASLNIQELKMALGRKLVKNQAYPEALKVFKSSAEPSLMEGPFGYYFSPIPNHYVMGKLVDESLLNPIVFLEYAASNQQKVIENPEDAEAWYQLGLASYNMSYWGNGWLFSDREWSSMEIYYGEPTEEDYFTNAYAKECFEKALAANPEPELGAQICYMGALCEKNQYFLAYAGGKPNTYNAAELNRYHVKMEKGVLPTFQSFFRRLKNQYDETAYESQVIKECLSYENYKMQ